MPAPVPSHPTTHTPGPTTGHLSCLPPPQPFHQSALCTDGTLRVAGRHREVVSSPMLQLHPNHQIQFANLECSPPGEGDYLSDSPSELHCALTPVSQQGRPEEVSRIQRGPRSWRGVLSTGLPRPPHRLCPVLSCSSEGTHPPPSSTWAPCGQGTPSDPLAAFIMTNLLRGKPFSGTPG